MTSTVDVPVLVDWTGRIWRLTYLRPCVLCGAKHQHGGGTDPAGAHLGSDEWGSHCPSSHRAPFGDFCEPVMDLNIGRRCHVDHSHMVRLHEATRSELEQALAGVVLR